MESLNVQSALHPGRTLAVGHSQHGWYAGWVGFVSPLGDDGGLLSGMYGRYFPTREEAVDFAMQFAVPPELTLEELEALEVEGW